MRKYSFLESKRHTSRKWKIFTIVFIITLICAMLFVFVVFPLVFMGSIKLQRLLMFMNINLPMDPTYFEKFKLDGKRNFYVPITRPGVDIKLGVWHILPHNLTNQSISNPNFDYDEALRYSNFSVLLCFHGSGEARSDFVEKDNVLREFFHIIKFDYRSFADSSKATLSEEHIVNDSMSLYRWLIMNTQSPIFVWSHSLGTALAAHTISRLQKISMDPKGLILESGFTYMREELPVHPYGKIFAWLPWFKQTVLDPLEQNNLIFNTSLHISVIRCPVMVLHAEDDSIVPYKFGKKLYEIAKSREFGQNNIAVYHQFPANMTYNHFYIYKDPHLLGYIKDFMKSCF